MSVYRVSTDTELRKHMGSPQLDCRIETPLGDFISPALPRKIHTIGSKACGVVIDEPIRRQEYETASSIYTFKGAAFRSLGNPTISFSSLLFTPNLIQTIEKQAPWSKRFGSLTLRSQPLASELWESASAWAAT